MRVVGGWVEGSSFREHAVRYVTSWEFNDWKVNETIGIHMQANDG